MTPLQPNPSPNPLPPIQSGYSDGIGNEIQTYACRAFAILAGGGAVTVLTLAAFEIVALPVALFAIPLTCMGGYALWKSNEDSAFENEGMLKKLREEAKKMTLDQLASRHGWAKIFTHQILSPDQFVAHYRTQVQSKGLTDLISYYNKVNSYVKAHNVKGKSYYFVPHPREWVGKWRQETESKTLEQIVTSYSLDALEGYSLVEKGELQQLKQLSTAYRQAEEIRQRAIEPSVICYEISTWQAKGELNAALQAADAEYNNHYIVVSFKALDGNQAREETGLFNQKGARINGIRERCSHQISDLTHGVPYRKLKPQQRTQYDQFEQQKNAAIQQIEEEVARHLQERKSVYQILKQNLSLEEERLRARRDGAKNGAQLQFDAQTALPRITQAERQRPFQEQFRRVVADLNATYCAYLRRCKAEASVV